MLPAHPRTSVPRTRSYNEEEHGKPLRAILGVDRRCYRRPTACSPTCPHPPPSLASSLFLRRLSFDIPPTFSIPPPPMCAEREKKKRGRVLFSSRNFSSYLLSRSYVEMSFLSALSLDIYADIYLYNHLADDPPIARR